MRNALTIDVEDWFQVAAFFPYIDRSSWQSRESRVVANTERLLAMLAERGIVVVTTDGSRAAHWEHTVAVTDSGPRILTV